MILKRGESLFYCQFDDFDPSRRIKLIQAEKAFDLMYCMEQVSSVVNCVNQMFNFLEEGEKIRPNKLF